MEGPRQQFELPLERSITDELLPDFEGRLPAALDVSADALTLTTDNDSLELRINAAGVCSVFVLDRYQGNISLQPEKSYDLFDDTDNPHNDQPVRPTKNEADIHTQRKNAVVKLLQELLDPPVIEN